MSSSDTELHLALLLSSPKAATAARTIDTILSNILTHPNDTKYASIKASSDTFQNNLANVPGALELLADAGFLIGEPRCLLAPDASLDRLTQVRDALRHATEAADASPLAAPPPPPPPPPPPDDVAPARSGATAAATPDVSAELQARVAARVKELFLELSASGMPPNEAAAEAFAQASAEIQGQAATPIDLTATSPPTPHAPPRPPDSSALLSKDGFEARVRQLFAEERARGADATAAAARAMERARSEMLAEANRARGASPGDAASAAAATPPLVETLEPSDADGGPAANFERVDDHEVVAQREVDAINALYLSDGVTFVDPSFPPTQTSLYADPRSASSWECRACGARNPLPPQPEPQAIFQLLTGRTRPIPTISCGQCSTEHALLETAMRPTDWLRPAMIRDDVTMQHSTVPWEVFRGDPRADDVRQGIVGNCWLVCALSCLAEQDPEMLKSIVLTREANRAGAYQIRLCPAGEWVTVLIDDVLPTNALGCSAYLKPARRSLWGPLIEKACAKLYGSYEALSGGTFAEAFSTLTGYPAQKVPLRSQRQQPPAPPAEAGAEATAAHARRLERWRAQQPDSDVVLGQLFSYRASGFAVGASTYAFPGEEALAREMKELGLQNPHAYCVLELETLRDEPCVKLRNPNGHAGWRGRWSRDSPEWTYELRAKHLDGEDDGVFWMSWSDFFRFFAEVTVCRILKGTMEAREKGWLPSSFNAGGAVSLEVYARTQVELALHQEPHRTRGVEAMQTFVDLGVAVLKDEGGGRFTLIEQGERAFNASLALSASLELDAHASRFLIVPLCFGLLGSTRPRRFRLATYTSQPISAQVVPLSAKLMATATILSVVAHGECQTLLSHPLMGDCLKIYTLESSSGVVLVAENVFGAPIRVELGAESCVGVVSSRGTLASYDVLPPNTRQVLAALTPEPRAKKINLAYQFGASVVDPRAEPNWAEMAHIPGLAQLGELQQLHEPQPIVAAGAGMVHDLESVLAPPGQGDGGDSSSPNGVSSLANLIWSQRR